jgi:hypothetical protein
MSNFTSGQILTASQLNSAFDAKADSAFTQIGTGAVARTVQDELRDRVSVKQFGAKGDGVTDDTAAILAAMQFVKAAKGTLVFAAGKYIVSDFLLTFADQEALTLEANGKVELYSNKTATRSTGSVLDYGLAGFGGTYPYDYFIRTQPTVVGTTTLTANAESSNVWLSVGDISLFQVGSLIRISSSRLIQTESRGGNIEGQMATVEEVDVTNSRIRIRDPLAYTAPANTITNGTVASVVASDTLTLSGISLTDAQARVQCFFPGRGNAYSYISRWNAATNTAYFRGMFALPLPSGVAVGDAVQLQWATTITVYTRYSFKMIGDFTLSRAPHLNATAGDEGYRGLSIFYAKECTIKGARIYHFSETGIHIWNCYRPQISDIYVYGSNRAFGVSNGTGYGVVIWGSYAPVVENISGAACRRLVDIAGLNAISWFGRVQGLQFDGGGMAYDGNEFWPAGPTYQFAAGSHGGAYYTKYIDVSAKDCREFFEIRGYREQIINMDLSGYCYACVYLNGGGTDLQIIGGSYQDGISDPEQNLNYQTSTMRGNTAKWFMYVDIQNDFPALGFSMRGVRATSISAAILNVDTTSSIGAISGGALTWSMSDCVFNVSRVGAGNNTFNGFILTPALADVNPRYTDGGGNRIIASDGSYLPTGTVSRFQFGVTWNQYPGSVIRLDDTSWLGCISDQSVLRIPVSGNAKLAHMTIFDRESGKSYRGEGIILSATSINDTSPLQATNKVGIGLSNVALTGATGTAGNVTLSFRPTGTDPVTGNPATYSLYIENRTGGTVYPIFRLTLIE